MDSINCGPTQANPHPPMDGADWRTQLLPETRQRIVNKITDTLKRHLRCSGQEVLQELKQIAVGFEEKIYSVATSQSDYLRKISLKMLTMDAKPQNTLPTSAMPSNSRSVSINPLDADTCTDAVRQGFETMYIEADPQPGMDSVDWRTQLQPESRERIVNKIMDTLMRNLPFSGQEGLQELKQIATRFEEKIYSVATSQSDYLRKISLKMLTMDTKSQSTLPSAMPSNTSGASSNPQDPVYPDLELRL